MTHETEKLLENALKLPAAERADLAARLIASLDSGASEDIDKAWRSEIVKRVRRIMETRDRGLSAEEVARDVQDLVARIRAQPKGA